MITTYNNIFYINTLSYNKNNNIYNINNVIFYLNESKLNLSVGVDVWPNPRLGVDASKPNLGLGVAVSNPT
jgi:hypothetical protein